jgi:uncharacterized damage-inducible protein DinB
VFKDIFGTDVKELLMSAKVKWIERRFVFDFPHGHYPEILERIRGTPARMEDRLRAIPRKALTVKPDRGWSIQEHIGHLLDVDSLFIGRIDDFEKGVEKLRPADMSNQRTEQARHNERPLETILSAFRGQRTAFVERLEALPSVFFTREAIHPRLDVTMRVVDSLYFQAEHDDYHLARITEMLRSSSG